MPVAVTPNPAHTHINPFDYGTYSTPLPATTKNIGTPNAPVRRRVCLYDQLTGRILRELWSNALTGEYQFKALRVGTFFIISFDHTGTYNGEVVTGIKLPEHAA